MPPALFQALGKFRRRLKLLGVAMGLGLLLASAVAMLLAAVGLDYLLNLSGALRIGVVDAGLLALLVLLVRWVMRPMLARMSLSDVAGRLEEAFPQFDDRLRSTVDFSRHDIPGSEIMKRRVVDQAGEMAGRLKLSEAIAVRPVGISWAMAAGTLLVAAVAAWTAGPQLSRLALDRLLRPLADQPWPKRVQIEWVGQAPQRVAVGQRIDVKVRLVKGDRTSMKPLVFCQYDGGVPQQEYLTRAEDGTYIASLDARTEEGHTSGRMDLWVQAGDDQRQLPPIAVVQRLAIARVTATVTPPHYTGLLASQTDLGIGPATMVVGSDVKLEIRFNKPLSARPPAIESLTAGVPLPQIDWGHPDSFTATAHWIARQSIRFHIRAMDTDGFTNAALEEFELVVRPDQNPSVQIENPRRNEDCTAVATVPLQGAAEDDFGIRSLKLMVQRLGDHKTWEIPLVVDGAAAPLDGVAWTGLDSGPDRRRFRVNYAWNLATLQADLKSGDVLEYDLQVRDNYDLDGDVHKPVDSGRLRINIISQEQLTARAAEELRRIAAELTETKNLQVRTRAETQNLAADTRSRAPFDAADRAVADRLAGQQSTAAAQTKQLSGKLTELLDKLKQNQSPSQDLKDLSADVSVQLNDTAEGPMKDATSRIGHARDSQSDSAGQHNQDLQTADADQQAAADQLQKALDRLGAVAGLSQSIEQVRALLAEQQQISHDTAEVGRTNLGKTPNQMNPADRAKLDQTADAQARLAEKTDQTMAGMMKAADQMAAGDPSDAAALRQAAQTGDQQQVSSNMSRAADQAHQNQQADTQAAQKQAELGLQLILNDLREAERRKLEELAGKLEELLGQVVNLIRRQAGHNLDNLSLQGPQRVAAQAPKTMEQLLALSERGAAPPAPPPAGQLTASQEQTQRNTHDIAVSTEDLPNGAEPAELLTRAAMKMERAAAYLRDAKLADAYDPAQIEALAALQEAKSVIERQKADVDRKRQDQQRETIRQAYELIKADQEKLDVETARLDSAPRLQDGSRRREDSLRLNQLPGQQGQLADRTAKLEEDLSALGGVVYVWANRDIVTSMQQVKEDLNQPSTGAATQTREARIVRQLDAMIQDLSIKPPEDKFAQRGGGGSGSGNGGKAQPRLPPEAELRLLKNLQQTVNTDTKDLAARAAAAAGKQDKPQLLELGNRQGQLRNLLDQLLKQASQGKAALPPEPDPKSRLPEEADQGKIEDQELEQDLLHGKPDAEPAQTTVGQVGDRMARSRQRLALDDDPGKTTQLIQGKILQNLDDLINLARQQSSAQPKPGQGQPQQQQQKSQTAGAQPKNGDQKGQQQPKSQTPAGSSTVSGGSPAPADLSQDIRQRMAEWGGITPRQRQAVIEGAGENTIGKYQKLVDDYFRALAEQPANGQK